MANVDVMARITSKKAADTNQLSPIANLVFHIALILGSLCCLLPLWIVIAASVTEEATLTTVGYSLWPKVWSTVAYQFMFSQSQGSIFIAYKNTIIATVCGTILCVCSVGLYAYPLSRSDFRFSSFFTFFSFFTMLFNAGTVSFYCVVNQVLGLGNTIWVLFLPMSFSAYWVIIMRTFYKSNVPEAIIESARIDGASEWRTFIQIVAPLAVPGYATVALFAAVGIWNNFFNCLLFVTKRDYYNLQFTIYSILRSIQFLREMASAASGSGSAVGMVAIGDLPNESFRMAMAVVTMGPIVIAYPFFQKYFVKGLTIGAVKG